MIICELCEGLLDEINEAESVLLETGVLTMSEIERMGLVEALKIVIQVLLENGVEDVYD